MKSYGQFIDKSITLDESIVGRYFDSSRFGPGGNKNVTTGLKPNVPTVRQQQKTKPNNPTKPPLRATSQRPPACLLYTSPSPRDGLLSRMPSSA